jgi:hypothetical protein
MSAWTCRHTDGKAAPKDCSNSSSNPMMEDAMGRRREYCIHRRRCEPMERPMQKLNDVSRSLTALEPDGTLIAVVEMSVSS